MRVFYKIFIESSLTSETHINREWYETTTNEISLTPFDNVEYETEEDALKEIEEYFNQPCYPYQPKKDDKCVTILKMYGKSKE
jgi:hypothetical protein